ncbi:MAG TPA: hypothetical protein VF597_02605 [Candidatus Saccharimonadales bacterium]|jgi:hypothetical protein
MKRFTTLALSAAVLAAGLVSLMAPSAAHAAAATCDARGIGSKIFTKSTDNSAYKITGNKATVTFDVKGCDANGINISIIAWKAPNGTDGKPYDKQKMFAHDTKHFSNGRHTMTITLPDCYFQVDTVTGTKLTGSSGGAYNYDERQVAYMHGGTKSCEEKPVTPTTPTAPTTPTTPTTPETPVTPKTPVTPETPEAPETPATPVVQEEEVPTEVAKTGPEAVVAGFAGLGTMIASAGYWVQSRKNLIRL